MLFFLTRVKPRGTASITIGLFEAYNNCFHHLNLYLVDINLILKQLKHLGNLKYAIFYRYRFVIAVYQRY